MLKCKTIVSKLMRKKKFDEASLKETSLNRALDVWDLTSIGLGITICGIYILGGELITQYTGPAILISFALAGTACVLSALCYAELGARVPRAGSAYVWIYVSIGEIFGFLTGWDILLEYIIGAASVASSLSQYIDSLAGNAVKNYLKVHAPMRATGLGSYPDVLGFGLVMVLAIGLIFGVKESFFVNKIISVVLIVVSVIIIIVGAMKADPAFWFLDRPSNVTMFIDGENKTFCVANECGSGGFMPFGITGVVGGAAKCFYCYVGFDAITTSGEEVKNPKRTIPLSIFITLIVVTVIFFAISVVETMIFPYYAFDFYTPLPQAFRYYGIMWIQYVIYLASILSIAACLYNDLYPISRLTYGMARDGLLPRFLAWVHPRFKTPSLAIMIPSLFAAMLALLCDLNELIEMCAIGTLNCFSFVALCVLILRYTPDSVYYRKYPCEATKFDIRELLLPSYASKMCNKKSARIVNISTLIAVIDSIVLCLIVTRVPDLSKIYIIVIIALLWVVFVACNYVIWLQPQVKDIETFKAPLVPALPLLSSLANIYLMLNLSFITWMRLVVWQAVATGFEIATRIKKSHR